MSRRAGAPLDPRDLLCSALLFAAAAALYLGFLTQDFVFEGLARAMPIEVGRFKELFNGNYLLYGFLGNCFHLLLGSLGFRHLAVLSLQIMDSFIGALGVALFFRILRILGAGRFSAVVWAAVLGACLGFWSWSTDAQNYIFSALLLEINFLLLLSYAAGRRIHPAALGACHALAIFGHIVNGLFGLVGIAVLVQVHGRGWRKPVLQYALASAAATLAGYGAVLAFIVRPASFDALRQWFLGSLAPSGRLYWHGGFYSSRSLWTWLKMTLNIFVSYAPVYTRPPAWGWAGALLWGARLVLAGLVLKLVWDARRLEGLRRIAAWGCAAWLCAYALVFTSWEPGTMVYRVGDLVPLVLLLFLGAEARGPSLAAGAAAVLFAVLLGAGNFAAEIYPRSFASNSPTLSRMAFIKAHTVEGDWVAGDQNDELNIPYFSERRPLVMGRFEREPEAFRRFLKGLLASGQSVYLTSRVLAKPFWRDYFREARLVLKAKDQDGFELYRLASLTAR